MYHLGCVFPKLPKQSGRLFINLYVTRLIYFSFPWFGDSSETSNLKNEDQKPPWTHKKNNFSPIHLLIASIHRPSSVFFLQVLFGETTYFFLSFCIRLVVRCLEVFNWWWKANTSFEAPICENKIISPPFSFAGLFSSTLYILGESCPLTVQNHGNKFTYCTTIQVLKNNIYIYISSTGILIIQTGKNSLIHHTLKTIQTTLFHPPIFHPKSSINTDLREALPLHSPYQPWQYHLPFRTAPCQTGPPVGKIAKSHIVRWEKFWY